MSDKSEGYIEGTITIYRVPPYFGSLRFPELKIAFQLNGRDFIQFQRDRMILDRWLYDKRELRDCRIEICKEFSPKGSK